MALHKIKDFDPNYRESFDNQDLIGYDLYSGDDKIGSIDDLLVDDDGRFRYFVINTGVWIFGKRVLLPVGQTRVSSGDRRVYATNLTRDQVENLPEYKDNMTVDYDQEERVRQVYRPGASSAAVGSAGMAGASTLESSAALDQNTIPLESSAPLETDIHQTTSLETNQTISETTASAAIPVTNYDRTNYRYDQEPNLYGMNDRDHQTLRLYEERLVANKHRERTGAVTVGKRVETETAHVAIPVEKERVVIERVTSTTEGTVAGDVVEGAFQEGEVVRMEVYEEAPDVRKEAFVREEVTVRKEVERDNVEVEDTIRREDVRIDTDGNPIIDDASNRAL